MGIEGVSYAGRPIDNTAMYVTKKVEHLLNNLTAVVGCKVFVETGSVVPKAVLEKNEIVYTDSPQRDYAIFVNQMADERIDKNKNRVISLSDGGYYIGENVKIGEGAVIEAGSFLGHDVIIGKNAIIKSGAIIKD
jgi:UDP-3-O-[3-hydroxymyristoyl] glucosamine N-acyltransferase